MKTWEKILLYPIGLYLWLTDGIKKMSKKWKPAMAMLMAVVMLCSLLPITAVAATDHKLWVGGVHVTSDNAANITGDGISGKVSYDAETKTLTLENATITSVYEFSTLYHDAAGIYTELPLTIRLIGENTITGSFLGGSSYAIYARYSTLTIAGNGHLNISAVDAPEYWSVGIYNGSRGVTIEDGCSLTVSCSTNGTITYAIYNNLRFVKLPEGYVGIGGEQPDGSDASVIGTETYPYYTYINISRGGAVTLNTDDGAIDSGDVKYYFSDTGATLPQNVTKEGYIFGGWYDNADCTGQAVTKIPAGETGAKEYWAKWTEEAPATQPTEPTTQPTTPATQPTTPATQPTTPATQPTTPATQPTTPATQPTTPATQPTTPATQPTTPATQPTTPATQPTEPTTQPTEPTTPGTVPSEPATEPSQSATEPSQSATEPSTAPQGSATQPENNQTGTPDDPQSPPIGLYIGIGLGVVALIAIVVVVLTKKKS